ncbi:MAG: hypothetical protein ACI9MJ_000467, partial [Alphaproteobacteria bacterium]
MNTPLRTRDTDHQALPVRRQDFTACRDSKAMGAN